ncbi:hypothetical protein COLO4_16412 [Corchorus olitorius]|uniref:Uncharacterized protein n=1 Tax=Corchorus olitorius TaxID=93759 RepID=A0A1R3JHI0_9ROSI|nr:hypothetical protein COLO4_16412 [Corchorus olitorius]
MSYDSSGSSTTPTLLAKNNATTTRADGLPPLITINAAAQLPIKLSQHMIDGSNRINYYYIGEHSDNIRMLEDETVKQYADRIMIVVNKIRLLGDNNFGETRVIDKIMSTLPEKYENTIATMEMISEDDECTLKEL